MFIVPKMLVLMVLIGLYLLMQYSVICTEIKSGTKAVEKMLLWNSGPLKEGKSLSPSEMAKDVTHSSAQVRHKELGSSS